MEVNIYNEPEKLLQRLIQFDTSNPPGNEKGCCLYIKELLDAAGVETKLYALDENRPNLWAEIKSENPVKPPVLMYGHIDVVPAEQQGWKHPPFGGVIDGGYVYGRGAADMKSGIAMFISVILKVKLEQIKLDFDLCLLVLSDEEDIGTYGAKFMAQKHPELFKDIGFALGEMGGYPLYMHGKKFYPIMIAEKQCAAVKLTFSGKSGHGSAKHTGTAMGKMAAAVAALSENRLKTRITPEVSLMLREISKGLGLRGFLIKQLTNPLFTNIVLDILKEDGTGYDNLLHNSVNITIVRGGASVNVVPGSVSICADLRLLPGCALKTALEDIEDVLRKKAGLSASDYEIEVLDYDKNDSKPELRYFDLLKAALLEADPNGIPVPYVFGAVTDARIFSEVGVMTYGYTPLLLPEGFDFFAQAHATNERLPVNSLQFGIKVIISALKKHGTLNHS